MNDPIHDRGHQLEDLFFKKVDSELLASIKQAQESAKDRHDLAVVSGIDDAEAIAALVASGVTADSMTSISLIPLVMVAWSDHRMESAERFAILKAAEQSGIEKGTASYQLLEHWLKSEPPHGLLDAWKSYIEALKDKTDEVVMNQLKSSILERAEHVARTAGGFLGIGQTISPSEHKVLEELAEVF